MCYVSIGGLFLGVCKLCFGYLLRNLLLFSCLKIFYLSMNLNSLLNNLIVDFACGSAVILFIRTNWKLNTYILNIHKFAHYMTNHRIIDHKAFYLFNFGHRETCCSWTNRKLWRVLFCEWEVTKSAELTSKLLNLYFEWEAVLEQIQLSGLVIITTVMAGFTVVLVNPHIEENTNATNGPVIPNEYVPNTLYCGSLILAAGFEI